MSGIGFFVDIFFVVFALLIFYNMLQSKSEKQAAARKVGAK